MALKPTGNKKVNQENQTAGQQDSFAGDFQESRSSQQQTRGQRRDGRGMRNRDTSIRRHAKKSQMGEAVSSFVREATNIIEDIGSEEFQFRLLALDSARYETYYSSVAVVGLTEVNGERVVAVHTLLLAGSAKVPAPKILNIHNTQVEFVRTPMCAWGPSMLKKVERAVSDHYGNVRILRAHACVVPKEVNIESKDEVYPLIWNAHEALMSCVETAYPAEFEKFNVATFVNPAEDRVVANVAYGSGDAESVTGLPVRSDVNINLVSTERNQNDVHIDDFQHEATKQLIETDAFVDLIYSPSMEMPQPGQPPVTQVFFPQVTLTKIAVPESHFTPETFFLGVAGSMLLGEHFAWASVFSNYNQDPLHDIGAIGYRLQNPQDPSAPGKAIETSSSTFGDAELFDLLSTTVHATPIFALDVEEVGPESWLTTALIDAAPSNGDRDAYNYLIEALDNLTDGHFSQVFEAGTPIAETMNCRVHLGTYTDKDGNLRDIRDIDSLAILNHFGDRDMNAVNDWESTFNDSSAPIEMRLERRYQILRQVAGSNLNIRGYAERMFFTRTFTVALITAIQRAGLSVDQDGLRTMFGQNRTVGNTFIGQYATNAGASGLINVGGPQGGYQDMTRHRASRWY